jgi:MSHA biogenesis protein MshO
MRDPARTAAGFTLIEMIMVIVITGVIAGMVAVFIKAPVDSYFDASRRAELTDLADTTVRRMARDLRLALPNSVRHPADGSTQCLEFMPTKIGGRYRAVPTNSGTGDALDFTATDDKFDMLWLNSSLPAGDRIVAGDVVAVYNDGSGSGNAYGGSNAVAVAGVAEPGGTAGTTEISFVGTGASTPFNRKQLPADSPSHRFQVIPAGEHVVAYACSGGTLYRYRRTLSGSWAQPANCAAMTSGATAATLVGSLGACSIKYEPPGSASGATGRFGIVAISLEISQSGEAVKLYHQVRVDNTP